MRILRAISFLIVGVVLTTYMGCKPKGSDPEPIPNVQFDKLKKTWKINTASFDGTDRTAEYTGFQLVFNGTKGAPPFTYTTSGRPSLSPWKASGAWEFGANPETQIIRDKGTLDELGLTYSVTESTLTISFNFSGTGYSSRTEQVQGPWIFTFTL